MDSADIGFRFHDPDRRRGAGRRREILFGLRRSNDAVLADNARERPDRRADEALAAALHRAFRDAPGSRYRLDRRHPDQRAERHARADRAAVADRFDRARRSGRTRGARHLCAEPVRRHRPIQRHADHRHRNPAAGWRTPRRISFLPKRATPRPKRLSSLSNGSGSARAHMFASSGLRAPTTGRTRFRASAPYAMGSIRAGDPRSDRALRLFLAGRIIVRTRASVRPSPRRPGQGAARARRS